MREIKIGSLPGRINTFMVEEGTTFAQAIELAELDATNKEVKSNGTTVTDLNAVVGEDVERILLCAKIKGNAESVKVGTLPGRLNEYVFEAGTTYAEAIAIAGLETEGYEIKSNGQTITNLEEVVSEDVTRILLAKKIKGNVRS